MKRLVLIPIALCVLALLSCVHASPGSYTVTLNLHKASSVTTINTKSSAGQIFNTTASWSGSTQENSSEVAAGNYWSVFFYLYPTLASTLTLNGAVTATPFLKANASVSDVTLITTLNKISAAGASTQISTKSNTSVSLATSYAEKTSPHSSVSTTVASGFTLELNVTVGGSASNLTAYIGYDTAAVNSRIALVATDPLTNSVVSGRSSYERDEAATLTVTITNVWGGYDIASAPTLTFTYPNGVTATSTASSTGDTQYTNTYTSTFTKLSASGEAGTWTGTASVSDQNSNSYTSSSFSFVVVIDPGGFNWSPDDQPVNFDPASIDPTLIIIVVVVGMLALLAVKGRGKRKKRRR